MPDDETKKKPALKAVGGLASIPVVFGVLGLIAQLSQYEFLGLPTEQSRSDLMDLVKSSETEGFYFLFHTVTDAGFSYLGENPYAIVAVALVLAFFLLFFLLRKKKVAVVTEPLFLLVLIFAGSLLVLMRYDAPAHPFMNVLRSQSTTIEAFEIPPAFQARAQQMWTDIVCAKVASSPASMAVCSAYSQARYKQSVDGRYFLNVLFTTSMAVLFVLLYLLREPAQTKELLRNILFTLAALAVTLNLLALPYVYSRSVRSTIFPVGHPRQASTSSPAYTICTSKECFGYRLESADFDVSSSDIVIDNPAGDDVFRDHLLEAFGAPPVHPPKEKPMHLETK